MFVAPVYAFAATAGSYPVMFPRISRLLAMDGQVRAVTISMLFCSTHDLVQVWRLLLKMIPLASVCDSSVVFLRVDLVLCSYIILRRRSGCDFRRTESVFFEST